MSQKCSVYLVAGGRFHDTGFARLELLKLLAELPRAHVRVGKDFSDLDEILASDFLISYTCDVRPTLVQQALLRTFLERGGKWFALHGTNSLLDFDTTDGPIEAFGVTIPGVPYAPDLAPDYMAMLGTRFITHPPIQPFRVMVTRPDHPLVAGLEDFIATDEPYCCEVLSDIEVLLGSRYSSDVITEWGKWFKHAWPHSAVEHELFPASLKDGSNPLAQRFQAPDADPARLVDRAEFINGPQLADELTLNLNNISVCRDPKDEHDDRYYFHDEECKRDEKRWVILKV